MLQGSCKEVGPHGVCVGLAASFPSFSSDHTMAPLAPSGLPSPRRSFPASPRVLLEAYRVLCPRVYRNCAQTHGRRSLIPGAVRWWPGPRAPHISTGGAAGGKHLGSKTLWNWKVGSRHMVEMTVDEGRGGVASAVSPKARSGDRTAIGGHHVGCPSGVLRCSHTGMVPRGRRQARLFLL